MFKQSKKPVIFDTGEFFEVVRSLKWDDVADCGDTSDNEVVFIMRQNARVIPESDMLLFLSGLDEAIEVAIWRDLHLRFAGRDAGDPEVSLALIHATAKWQRARNTMVWRTLHMARLRLIKLQVCADPNMAAA